MWTFLIPIIFLVVIFAIGALSSANIGALALVAASIIGPLMFGYSLNELLSGFPGDLFVTLVGVTYLFSIARSNGTIDWLVAGVLRTARGNAVAVLIGLYLLGAAFSAVGAAGPAVVGILAPIGLRLCQRYAISPLFISVMICEAVVAGSFSPIGVLGIITNDTAGHYRLGLNGGLVFAIRMLFSITLVLVAYYILRRSMVATPVAERAAAGGPPTSGSAGSTAVGYSAVSEDPQQNRVSRPSVECVLTLLAFVFLTVSAVAFSLDIGFVSLGCAVVLSLIFPVNTKDAVRQVSWPTVLLVCGIVTYINLLTKAGVVDWAGKNVASVAVPLVAAFLVCLIAGAISAFASTIGLMGSLIPLIVPLVMAGGIPALGLVAALTVSASVVDCSPISTSGALCVANADESQRDQLYSGLFRWAMSMVVVGAVVSWLILVLLPTWL
jgi:di/tricarboxylate transporter